MSSFSHEQISSKDIEVGKSYKLLGGEASRYYVIFKTSHKVYYIVNLTGNIYSIYMDYPYEWWTLYETH
jgi:hypothetical protein